MFLLFEKHLDVQKGYYTFVCKLNFLRATFFTCYLLKNRKLEPIETLTFR